MAISRLPVPEQPYDGRGKVLRVKEGFNPNSSSMGSIVFSMSMALIAAPVVLGAAASLICAAGLKKDSPETPPASEPESASEVPEEGADQ